MKNNLLNDGRYDVIIIGAGISGLVCGNYLAKAGLRVLIIEQHYKVGGYCTSFKRGPFIFDAGVHELTHCDENKMLGKIIKSLEIDKRIYVKRFPESDIIVINGYKIYIKEDYSETSRQLEYYFPKEKERIRHFFALFKKPIFFSLYNKLKDRSFKEFLDEYFLDDRLKDFWYAICAKFGLLPSKLAAIVGFSFCRTIIQDSGYYPIGGMQAFSNAFLDTYKEFGGEIILSNKVTKMAVNNQKIASVSLSTGLRFYTNCVVSTCDPIQTYFMLIGQEHLDTKFLKRIENMIPAPSSFIVFLGLNRLLRKDIGKCFAIVYYPEYLPNSRYDLVNHFNPYLKDMVFVPSSFSDPKLAPGNIESIYMFKFVPYSSKEYWDENKFQIAESMINNAEVLIPNLKKYIAHMEIATPHTLYKYTLNYKGSITGLGAALSTTGLKMRDFVSPINGLFMAGHWAPSLVGNGGISMAASSGLQTAEKIKHQFREMKI